MKNCKKNVEIPDLKISEKLHERNPFKQMMYRLENKKENGVFYRIFLLIFLVIYLLFFTAKFFSAGYVNISVILLYTFLLYFSCQYRSRLIFSNYSDNNVNFFPKEMEKLLLKFFVILMLVVLFRDCNYGADKNINNTIYNYNMVVIGVMSFAVLCVVSNMYSVFQRYVMFLKTTNAYFLGICNLIVIPLFALDVYYRALLSQSSVIFFLALFLMFFAVYFFFSYLIFLYMLVIRHMAIKINGRGDL